MPGRHQAWQQEAALLAARADVREELDPAPRAHVQEARDAARHRKTRSDASSISCAQEFNREANALCSKSSDIALTRTGLCGFQSDAIDQFREQAQNVE